ncbi:hypothetical protein [Pseudonocardia sp. GCM10023141]
MSFDVETLCGRGNDGPHDRPRVHARRRHLDVVARGAAAYVVS